MSAPTVVLKLDDVVNAGHGPGAHWQRVTDFLVAQRIKAGFGIICDSLEADDPEYFAWITRLQAGGLIEFWLHGYRNRITADVPGEFEHGSAAEHRAVLEHCQQLAQRRLGFTFTAFGSHWTGLNDTFYQAIQEVPSLRVWLYGPVPGTTAYSRASLVRAVSLENPTFVTDYDKFVASYREAGHRQRVLCLQGHPDRWEGMRWEGFTRIIGFLQSEGCAFATPSEALTLVD